MTEAAAAISRAESFQFPISNSQFPIQSPDHPITQSPDSPVFVFRPVQRRAAERRIDVEDVLSAPVRRVRLVLVRPLAPVGALRHRIDRDLAEELQLPS